MIAETDRRCQHCRYWHRPIDVATGRYVMSLIRGECRRYPPTRIVTMKRGNSSVEPPAWPETVNDQWCGEWKK